MSNYTECPCCGDVTVSEDSCKPELCTLCEEAGCEGACQRTDFEKDDDLDGDRSPDSFDVSDIDTEI